MRISIPYGRNFLKAEVPNLIATLEPPYVKELDDPKTVLMDKLENPIGPPSSVFSRKQEKRRNRN